MKIAAYICTALLAVIMAGCADGKKEVPVAVVQTYVDDLPEVGKWYLTRPILKDCVPKPDDRGMVSFAKLEKAYLCSEGNTAEAKARFESLRAAVVERSKKKTALKSKVGKINKKAKKKVTSSSQAWWGM
jgi:hypothetical protein